MPEKWNISIRLKYLLEKNCEEICQEHKHTPTNLWKIYTDQEFPLRNVLIINGLETNSEMKKLMNMLFLSCLKASELIEKKIHFRLSFTEKLRLSVHKSMCGACTRYERQSIFLEKGISYSQKISTPQKDLEELKRIINAKLESGLSK